MWRMLILLGLLRHVNIFITIHDSTEVFTAFSSIGHSLQHVPRFTAVVIVREANLTSVRDTSLRSCLLLSSLWRRAGVVIKRSTVWLLLITNELIAVYVSQPSASA